MNLSDAVREGNHRESLLALRDLLADSVLEAEVDKRAPLAKQLTDVLREIEDLTEPEVSALDDLAARRSARLSDSTGTVAT